MEHSSSVEMHQSLDDRPVADVVLGIYGYNAVLAAHRLKLFPLLAAGPRALPDVCAALGIKPRPAQAILAAASACSASVRKRCSPPKACCASVCTARSTGS